MILSFEDITNKHQNQTGFVLGLGPSLNEYLDKLQIFKEQGNILISCNNWNEFFPQSPPHYWVNCNSIDNSFNMKDRINTYDSTWLYADSVDLTPKDWIENNLKVDYLPFDQRHFEGNSCYCCDKYGCKKHVDKKRLTLQEELQKYSGYDKHYSPGHTVALHMLSFAILLGLKKIYVIGLDFDYNLGYATNSTDRKPPESLDFFDKHRHGEDILKDIDIIVNSGKLVEVNFINLNKNSSWDNIEIGKIE